MKSHKKIIVSDELIAERINDCGTFSDQYLDALTDQQWQTLREGRISRLNSLQSKVRFNENKIGIASAMDEHRFMRVKRISNREKQIRDLYFAIEPKDIRIGAINDLCAYDRALLYYYHETILIEARHQYMAVSAKIMQWDDWKKLFKRFSMIILCTSAIATLSYIVRFIFAANLSEKFSLARFIEEWFSLFIITGLIDLGQKKWTEICEERDRLVDWKIARARFDIDENFTIGNMRIFSSDLFSDQEKLTGERGGELSPNRW
jgi:hypothetical protein